ncbi:gluconeogenesis factor YvcK family protein [Corynebacterium hadale]|uniref:gluconeogenesis factor YvcK family protein n=1 Tax=Corynebacterium hadale TaxID=2026255 RepID=UPI000BAA6DBA|nr:uridine diphosphate-N-acetylglucosamine-binding protein YvcK [Corynebacterium hadale]PAT09230.1 hypothetical protein CKJ82_00625 [Corynebacterium hadale]
MSSSERLAFTCLGGGHGLYQTLLAARRAQATDVNAVVTVADDGGSSGRLRREFPIIPPGDLRMATAALTADDEDGELWREALQHRFGGNGVMAGHPLGNLMLVSLVERFGDMQTALDIVGKWTRSAGRVIPMCSQPLDIEADVSGLDDDPRVLRSVRGQAAVASTSGAVRRVRLLPEQPAASAEAVAAIRDADIVTIGPGSWFSSVLPHLLVPEIVAALNQTDAMVVVMLNLLPQAGETPGFSTERHIHVLSQHAPELQVDYLLADNHISPSEGERTHLQRAAERLGAKIAFRDVHQPVPEGKQAEKHDPDKLATAILELYRAR